MTGDVRTLSPDRPCARSRRATTPIPPSMTRETPRPVGAHLAVCRPYLPGSPNAGDYFTFTHRRTRTSSPSVAATAWSGPSTMSASTGRTSWSRAPARAGSSSAPTTPGPTSMTAGLRAGPNLKAVEGFDRKRDPPDRGPKRRGLLRFPLRQSRPGRRADGRSGSPASRQELRAFVPHIDKLQPLEWVEVPERCNWKVSVENYSECYHCALNHKTFATGVIKPETYDIQPQGHCLRHTTECQNLDKHDLPRSTRRPTSSPRWTRARGSSGRCSRSRSIRATC